MFKSLPRWFLLIVVTLNLALMDVANWYANHRPDMICGSGSSAVAIAPTLFRCWLGNGTWTTGWNPPAAPSCPGGYVMNGSSCSIGPAGPDAVPKPPGTDCQAYFKAGKFSFDNLNPACLTPDGTAGPPHSDGMTAIGATGFLHKQPDIVSTPRFCPHDGTRFDRGANLHHDGHVPRHVLPLPECSRRRGRRGVIRC